MFPLFASTLQLIKTLNKTYFRRLSHSKAFNAKINHCPRYQSKAYLIAIDFTRCREKADGDEPEKVTVGD